MPRQIVHIYGVPGVGKTFLIKELLLKETGFVHLSAGSLIKQGLTEEERDSLRLLDKDSILLNQETLVQNFNKAMMLNDLKNIILDAHILINNGTELVKVPFDIIKRLSPSKIIYISDTPSNIICKRNKDINRPQRAKESSEEIANLINQSVSVCLDYAKKLDIPFTLLEAPSVDTLMLKI